MCECCLFGGLPDFEISVCTAVLALQCCLGGGGGGSKTHPRIILGWGRYLGIQEYLSRLRDNLPHPRIIPGLDGSYGSGGYLSSNSGVHRPVLVSLEMSGRGCRSREGKAAEVEKGTF